MSTSTGIALLVAANFAAFFGNFYVAKLANAAAAQVATGVVRAVPVPTEFRSILLHQVWVGYIGGGVICMVFDGFLNLRIAALVTDQNVRALAHAVAFVTFTGAFFWLLKALTEYVYYRSLLRRSERN